MANGMKRENKTRQTAVKYSPSFEARFEKAIHSSHTPRSAMFLDMLELAVEFSERTGLRLEDVPAEIRRLCAEPPKSDPTVGRRPSEPDTRSAMGTVKRTMPLPKEPPVPLNGCDAPSGERLSDDLVQFLTEGKTLEGGDA